LNPVLHTAQSGQGEKRHTAIFAGVLFTLAQLFRQIKAIVQRHPNIRDGGIRM
jgi:hypothetical protein